MDMTAILQLVSCIATAILTAISGFHVVKIHSKTKSKLSRKQKKAILLEYEKAKG